MNPCLQNESGQVHRDDRLHVFDRLDRILEENAPWDNSEKIRLMRQAYFADVDELERSGEIVLP